MAKPGSALISIYAENTPSASDRVAFGLSRALVPILLALDKDLHQVVILPVHDINRNLQPVAFIKGRVLRIGKWPVVFTKLFNRYSERAMKLWVAFYFNSFHKKRCKIAKGVVFSTIGSDYRSLIRASIFASCRGEELCVYLVDSFSLTTTSYSERDKAMARRQISMILKACVSVYVITESLKNQVADEFGCVGDVVSLPYHRERYDEGIDVKNQFIYLGSINYLYSDTLAWFIDQLAKFNEGNSDIITLRLTCNETDAMKHLGSPLPCFIRCGPIQDRSQLLSEVASSRCALMPYSFSDSAKHMVQSSFPSKMLDYLYCARDILVIAPSYSSITSLAKRLPVRYVDALSDSLATFFQQEYSQKNHMAYFRSVLEAEFSMESFRDQVLTSRLLKKTLAADYLT